MSYNVVKGRKGFQPRDVALTAQYAYRPTVDVLAVPVFGLHDKLREFTFVDSVEAWVLDYRWSTAAGYAYRFAHRERVALHRELLGTDLDSCYEVDHINGDPLDNRRSNLRLVTHAQNQQNTRSRRGSTSRFRGVSWNKTKARWQAFVHLNGKSHYLGLFDDEVEAATVAHTWRCEHMPFSSETM